MKPGTLVTVLLAHHIRPAGRARVVRPVGKTHHLVTFTAVKKTILVSTAFLRKEVENG